MANASCRCGDPECPGAGTACDGWVEAVLEVARRETAREIAIWLEAAFHQVGCENADTWVVPQIRERFGLEDGDD